MSWLWILTEHKMKNQGLPDNAELHAAVVSRGRLAGKKGKEAGVIDLHGDDVIGKCR